MNKLNLRQLFGDFFRRFERASDERALFDVIGPIRRIVEKVDKFVNL